jgi:hypothetical protein
MATPAQALTAPVLSYSQVSETSVRLSWTDAGNEREYWVYRSGIKITDLGANTLGWDATGLTPATTYTFRVDAKRGGSTAPSNPVTVTTLGGPPPTCQGVQVPAGSDLQTVSSANPPGTTFCLAAGTFTVPFSPNFSSVTWETGDVIQGAGIGVTVIDGTAVSSAMFGGYGYTVRDLSIGHAGRHISTGQACDGNDSLCGAAFSTRNSTLTNIRCFDNGSDCIAYGSGDLILSNIECDGNGWHPSGLNIQAACIKITSAGGDLTVTGSNIHDNFGAGIWGDYCGATHVHGCHWLIDGNSIDRNTLTGIAWEVSGNHNAGDNIIIRNNTIQNNGGASVSGGAGLVANDSSNLDAHHNIFGGNVVWNGSQVVCCRGFVAWEGMRDPAAMYNVTVHDNTMNGDAVDYCAPDNPGVICTNNTP